MIFAVAASGSAALAQVPVGAVAEARTRGVCGAGTVVSAEYIPGNLLKATCRQNSSSETAADQGLPDELWGGLSTEAWISVVITGVVLGVALGSDGEDAAAETTTYDMYAE